MEHQMEKQMEDERCLFEGPRHKDNNALAVMEIS